MLGICNRACEKATDDMSRVPIIIKNYSRNKQPYIQIRLFAVKVNEDFKQIAYINNNLSEFKELFQIWETLFLLIFLSSSKALS